MDISYKPRREDDLRREPLDRLWVRRHAPERFAAMREMDNSHHKENKPGLTYFGSTGLLVSHESRLESVALLMLDWEGDTVAIAAQPFTLEFQRGRKPASHTPDYFARLRDGTGVVIDVKPRKFLNDADVAQQHGLAREVTRQTGWRFRIMSEPPLRLRRNLHLLAGYRDSPAIDNFNLPSHIRAALRSGPMPYGELAAEVAASARISAAVVKPHILHGLWTRELTADLNTELTVHTTIGTHQGADA